MRIISGKRRGYKLSPPCGDNTRPTTDRVKESLFNIIQTRFPCRVALDLFSGSGALGIEALSRGCRGVVFVEKDKSALSVIRKNLEGSGLDSLAAVYDKDAFEFLSALSSGSLGVTINGERVSIDRERGFDVIFLDPPYNKGLLKKALDMIYELELLDKNGIIVAETEVGGDELKHTEFHIKKSAKYGKTILTVMQR